MRSNPERTGRWVPLALSLVVALVAFGPGDAAQAAFHNGFEVDIHGWDVFTMLYWPERVPSGTNGVESAGGGWHAQTGLAATDWGGYEFTFPSGGYVTSVDVFLDMGLNQEVGTDIRFAFTSAINRAGENKHLSDFVISVGTDRTTPGRFVASVSQNSPGWPSDPNRNPQVIEETGWYTIRHTFWDDNGLLAVDVELLDADGNLVAFWEAPTLYDPDGDGVYDDDLTIEVVGGNRYGWFSYNEFDFLAFDNSMKNGNQREVRIDVRPNNDGNQINTSAKMLVPIAILGEADFDPVSEVDLESITVRGAAPSTTRFDSEDVNDDGFRDLILYFRGRNFVPKPDPVTECGNPDAAICLGEGSSTMGELPLAGCDFVTWQGPDCKQ